MIINLQKINDTIIERLKNYPKNNNELAIIFVGNNFASESFINSKQKVASMFGVNVRVYRYEEDIKEEILFNEIESIVARCEVGVVIVHLPLPESIRRDHILNAISPSKDIDVLGSELIEKFKKGESNILPPSVATVEEVIMSEHLIISDMEVGVFGAGFLIGKPCYTWFKNRAKKINLYDLGDNIDSVKNCDLIILGVGKPNILDSSFIKSGAYILDFGYNRDKDNKIIGDFNISENDEDRINYTKVPGGLGPILILKLIENYFKINS